MQRNARARPVWGGWVRASSGWKWMMGEKIATAQGKTVTKMSLEGKKLSSDGK